MSKDLHSCPVCGGSIIGDGYTIARHCENVDLPLDREVDAPILLCEEKTDYEIHREEILAERINANERVDKLIERLNIVNTILKPTKSFKDLIENNERVMKEILYGYPDCIDCEDTGKVRNNRTTDDGIHILGKKICFCQYYKEKRK